MSRVQEIKRKQEIQAKFQLAVGQSNQQALNWLGGSRASETTSDEFLALPIVSDGRGLSLGGGSTIGEFVSSGVKNQAATSVSAGKGVKDSKALNALRNKMRDSSRAKQRNTTRPQASANSRSKPQTKMQVPTADSDDSEDERPVETTRKKFRSFLDKK